MPLNIELPPYQLESILSRDNYFTHYDATDAEGERYIVTEFCPAYMISRTELGKLDVTPRFTNEYGQSLDRFLDMAYAMKNINDVPIARIETVTQWNNTAYVVRKVNTFPSLDVFMGDKRMSVPEAYVFIRPLLLSLSQAEKNGVLFRFTDEDLRVNRYGQLQMDCVYTWDGDFHEAISEIIKLLFRLITGKKYAAVKTLPSAMGVELPPRLDEMMNEALGGDILYGSIEDFNKKLKFVMEHTTKKESGGAQQDVVARVMKWAIAALSLLLIFAIGFLLIYKVVIPAYNTAHPNLSDPGLIKTLPTVSPIASHEKNFSAIAVTDPGNPNDILNGAFCAYEDVLYYRAWNNGYYLARREADGTESALLHDVRPAFITVQGEYVYFCDGLSGYKIYRVKKNGGHAELLSENSASFLSMEGDKLYYTNHNDRDRLYRLDLNTREEAPYIKNAAYETVTQQGQLFFINGSHHFNLYAAETGDTPQLSHLGEVNGDNLRLYRNSLFFIDIEDGTIRCVTTDGRPVALDCPLKARAFDIDGAQMVIIENSTHRLYLYDLDTGERMKLSDTPAAYVYLADGAAYLVDYEDCRVTRHLVLPEMNTETDTETIDAAEATEDTTDTAEE